MVGMWMVQPMSLNCTTPGCSAGIICYGRGSMATAARIIAGKCWNEDVHLLMGSYTSLVPMVPIRPGAVPSYIGLLPSLHLPLDTFSKLRQMILACFAAFPVGASATFMTMVFLIPRGTL